MNEPEWLYREIWKTRHTIGQFIGIALIVSVFSFIFYMAVSK